MFSLMHGRLVPCWSRLAYDWFLVVWTQLLSASEFALPLAQPPRLSTSSPSPPEGAIVLTRNTRASVQTSSGESPAKLPSLSRNVPMADPLSIAASVAGLLSVSVKVGAIITSFISSVNDVPDSARAALSTVQGMRLTLTSVRHLIDTLSQLPKERKAMIHVRHLVVVFREAILSFSELEAIVVPPARSSENASAWDTVKWLLEEKNIVRAVQRLESHRASLSSMLNILQWYASEHAARGCH